MAANKLDRPRRGDGRMLAGVCGGLADHYGFNVTVVRVLFVVFAITGASEVVYLVLWLLMPNRG